MLRLIARSSVSSPLRFTPVPRTPTLSAAQFHHTGRRCLATTPKRPLPIFTQTQTTWTPPQTSATQTNLFSTPPPPPPPPSSFNAAFNPAVGVPPPHQLPAPPKSLFRRSLKWLLIGSTLVVVGCGLFFWLLLREVRELGYIVLDSIEDFNLTFREILLWKFQQQQQKKDGELLPSLQLFQNDIPLGSLETVSEDEMTTSLSDEDHTFLLKHLSPEWESTLDAQHSLSAILFQIDDMDVDLSLPADLGLVVSYSHLGQAIWFAAARAQSEGQEEDAKRLMKHARVAFASGIMIATIIVDIWRRKTAKANQVDEDLHESEAQEKLSRALRYRSEIYSSCGLYRDSDADRVDALHLYESRPNRTAVSLLPPSKQLNYWEAQLQFLELESIHDESEGNFSHALQCRTEMDRIRREHDTGDVHEQTYIWHVLRESYLALKCDEPHTAWSCYEDAFDMLQRLRASAAQPLDDARVAELTGADDITVDEFKAMQQEQIDAFEQLTERMRMATLKHTGGKIPTPKH